MYTGSFLLLLLLCNIKWRYDQECFVSEGYWWMSNQRFYVIINLWLLVVLVSVGSFSVFCKSV